MKKNIILISTLAAVAFGCAALTKSAAPVKATGGSYTNPDYAYCPNLDEVSPDSYITPIWESRVGATRIDENKVAVHDLAGWGNRAQIPGRTFDIASFYATFDLEGLSNNNTMMLIFGSAAGAYSTEKAKMLTIDFVKATNRNDLYQSVVSTTEHNISIPSYTDGQQWADEETSGYTVSSSKNGLEHTIISKGKDVDGTFVPAKKVGFNSITGGIYLESNCEVEYEHARTGSEEWVHLLLSQKFDNNLINIKNLSSLVMEADFTIDFCANKMGSEYNKGKHAAQLVWYITIQNRNKSSNEYGRYIWFGVPLWDNRTEGQTTNLYRAYDNGTSTLIYNPSSVDIFKNNAGKQPLIGQRALAQIDVLNIISEAFTYAKDNGYFTKTKFDDLAIGGTNFGYEIPGIFNIGSTIHAINVFYKNASLD